MKKNPPDDRPILSFNEKDNLINLMFDIAFIYPNTANELFTIYNNHEDRSITPGGRHIRNAIFVQLLQTYNMFVEQIFGWIYSLRIWKNNCNTNLLQLMEAVPTMSLSKVQETMNEFSSNDTKAVFLNDFITSASNVEKIKSDLSTHFNKLFSFIDFDEETTLGFIISKIYNKSKHGCLILNHPDYRTFLVPDKVDVKSKEISNVLPVFIPDNKIIFEYLKTSMNLAVIQFIKIIEIIYSQKYGELDTKWKRDIETLQQNETNLEKEYTEILKKLARKKD